jgi:hypothetical protein
VVGCSAKDHLLDSIAWMAEMSDFGCFITNRTPAEHRPLCSSGGAPAIQESNYQAPFAVTAGLVSDWLNKPLRYL